MAKPAIGINSPAFYVSFSIPPTTHPLFTHQNVRLVSKPKIGNLNNPWPLTYGFSLFPAGTDNDPYYAAVRAADWQEYFGYTVVNCGQYEGGILLHDMATQQHGTGYYAPFLNDGDILTSGNSYFPTSHWYHTTGLQRFSSWASGFAYYLKQECDSRGLSYPRYCLEDVEYYPLVFHAIRCSGEPTGFYNTGPSTGPDVGSFTAALSDPRFASLPITPSGETMQALYTEAVNVYGVGVNPTVYSLNSQHYAFIRWYDSITHEILSHILNTGYNLYMKSVMPDVTMSNYGGVQASRFRPYLNDGSFTPMAQFPRRNHLDKMAPVLYPVSTVFASGSETQSDTFRRMSLHNIAACKQGDPLKNITPWMLVPGLSLYSYTATVDDLVYIMNNGRDIYGVKEWLFFCGDNYSGWDNLQSAIDQHLSYVASKPLMNEILPKIGFSSRPSGVLPHTVFFNAWESNFNGADPFKCYYEWDFGDTTTLSSGNAATYSGIYGDLKHLHRTGNDWAKTRFTDHRTNAQLFTARNITNSGNVQFFERNRSLANNQNGPTAVYTYYNTGVYNISLRIWNESGYVSCTSHQTIVCNQTGAWVDTSVGAGSSPYTTLVNAINIANAHPTTGFTFRLGTTDTVATGITINRGNIRLLASNPFYWIATWNGSNGSRNPVPMLHIGPNARGVYIENYYPASTYNITGINIVAITSSGDEVVFNRFQGTNFRQHFTTSSGSNNHAIINSSFGQTREDGLLLNGKNYHIIGNDFSDVNLAKNPLLGYQVSIGDIKAQGFTVEFNQFQDILNPVLSGNVWISTYGSGGIFIRNLETGIINANIINHTSLFIESTGNNVVVKSNLIKTGASEGLIRANNISGYKFYNNILVVDKGSAYTSAVHITGSMSNVEFVNNTIVLMDNIHQSKGIINIDANQVSGCKFINNLFISDQSFNVSRYYKLVNPGSGIFFSNNSYAYRLDDVPFALIGSGKLTYFNWYPRETRFMYNELPLYTIRRQYNFAPRYSDYQYSDAGYYLPVDYIGNRRYNMAIGASEYTSDVQYSGLTPSITISPYKIYESRVSGFLPRENIKINITDSNNIDILHDKSVNGSGYILQNLGLDVYTQINYTLQSDGIDIYINYYNDNPNSTSGYQSLGSIYFNGFSLGKLVDILNCRDGTKFNEFDNNNYNIYNTNLLPESIGYPNEKFSNVSVIRNSGYTVGIGVMTNVFNKNKEIYETWTCNGSETNSDWALKYDFQDNVLSYAGQTGYRQPRTLLAYNEGLDVKISIRVSPNNYDWWNTLQPYKEWFNERFGYIRYVRDQRPIVGIVPTQTTFIATGNLLGFDPKFNINTSGYSVLSNIVKSFHNDRKYDRILLWSLGGLYNDSLSSQYNYPSLTISPLIEGSTVHNLYPTLYDLEPIIDLSYDIPSMGYYAGYGTILHNEWNIQPINGAGSIGGVQYSNSVLDVDVDNSLVLYPKLKEIELASDYLKSNTFFLDAYGVGLPLNQYVSYISLLTSLFPNMKIGAEASPCDAISLYGPSYLFHPNSSINAKTNWTYGPHILAEYLMPGHETCLFGTYDGFRYKFGSLSSTTDINGYYLPTGEYNNIALSLMEGISKNGYVAGTIDQPILESLPRYYTKDNRRVVNNIISDSENSPVSNLHFTVFNSILSFNYSYPRRYITLQWTHNKEPDFFAYKIYKSKLVNKIPNGEISILGYAKDNFYHDSAIEYNVNYTYRVSVLDIFGNETDYAEIYVTPLTETLLEDESERDAGNLAYYDCYWPAGMWPNLMWSDQMWPTCTLITDKLSNCVICYALDLISFVRLKTGLVKMVSNGVDFTSRVLLDNGINTYTDLNADLKLNQIIDTPYNSTEVNSNIVGIQTYIGDILNITSSVVDFNKTSIQIADLQSKSDVTDDVLSVYNTSIEYCPECNSDHCTCPE